ncbi:MAG TPA: NADH:ubiquinone reductase (Na(+)-transporting) subunit D, partial [Bacteroidetes bacterium]|nr:NADH:ubiquinone reductase (Na(+)-transporting) subunit D [Bacteroidota bacterium]
MSEVQTAAKQPTQLLGKKERRLLTDPFNDNNPITVQVLGICSALAVTVAVKNALVMSIAVMVVTGFANLIISLLRNTIPNRVRMIVQLVVIASLVSIVEMILHAFQYDVYK